MVCFFSCQKNYMTHTCLARSSLVVFIIFCCSLPKAFSRTAKASPLLIVSFDGFRWNYLNRTKTPNFHHVIHEGVWARKGTKSVFPTVTLTNHWSLVTGLYAESHGIVHNKMYDPVLNKTFFPSWSRYYTHNDPRFYDVPGVEPIWVANQLQKEHGRSGSVMWWGGEFSVGSVRPTFHMPYSLDIKGVERIDTVMKWFTDKYPINLGLLYFDGSDSVAHLTGPESENTTREIAHADKLTGYLLQQLEKFDLLDDINLIITSDHGFTAVSRDKWIMLDQFVNPAWYTAKNHYPVCDITPIPGYEDEIYTKLKAAASGNHFHVYKRAEIPQRLHFRNNIRIAPILAIADLPYSFIVNNTKESFHIKGIHGFDNKYDDMNPFFMAMGPSFKKGYVIETFNSIDIYALMCHLLHLTPAPNNGSLHTVSQLLKEHETTVWTFGTYIICLILIASVGGLFVVAACRQHRYLKRKVNQLKLSTSGTSKSNLFPTSRVKVRLLSEDEEDDDADL